MAPYFVFYEVFKVKIKIIFLKIKKVGFGVPTF